MSAAFNVGAELARGSAWMVGLRWALRGIGLVNTFILARLLLPGDFGLVAMAMVVIGLVEVLGETGQTLALIRLRSPTRAHYDAAWTLGILVAVAITAVLWAAAVPAAQYFHDPRASGMIRLLSLRTLLGGFENIGVVAFRRELRFERDFAFQLLQRVLVAAVTIGCALWLRDGRALAAGIIGGKALGVASSYLVHPYRPRLSLSRIPQMLGFSGWMLAVHVAEYVNGHADEFVVGGIASPAAMGLYNVAADVATAPTMEVTLPVTRALFPVFARIGDDAATLRAAYLDVFAATCIVSIAAGGGVALVAEDFVALALGPHWRAAVPLVRILAVAGGLFGIMHAAVPVLNATGHAGLSARLTASRAVAMLAAVAAAGWLGDVRIIALARVAVTALFIPGIFAAVARVLPVTVPDMLHRAWRPALAGVAMTAAVMAVHGVVPENPWARLPLDAASGAAAYLGALLLLWRLAGAPAGLEAAVMGRIWRRGR